jgi:hypothetical protein
VWWLVWCQFVTLSSTFDVDGIFYKGFVLIPNITARSQRQVKGTSSAV